MSLVNLGVMFVDHSVIFDSDVVEEFMLECVCCRASFFRDIFEHFGKEIDQEVFILNLRVLFFEGCLIFFVLREVFKNFTVIRHS